MNLIQNGRNFATCLLFKGAREEEILDVWYPMLCKYEPPNVHFGATYSGDGVGELVEGLFARWVKER